MVWKLLRSRLLVPLLAAMVALGMSAPAAAQTTGRLQLSFVDVDGLAIPRVNVRLEGPARAEERVTNDGGQYLFSDLDPGRYVVRAWADGFDEVTVSDVLVALSRTTPLTVEMRAASGEEVVVVAKEKAVDTSSTSRGQILTREFLDNVPAGRSYQEAVGLTAGVTGNGGNPSMGGGASNENVYMLDGVEITDPVTGTFSANFNFDAIQQIEVLLGGYMPEYPTSTGGIINLVTRTGDNNLEFQVGAFYGNGNFRPRLDERVTADGFASGPSGFDGTFETYQIVGLVSGPIVRDKAWFNVSYQGTRSLIALAGTPQRRDFDGHFFTANVTVEPAPDHRLSLNIRMDPTNIANQFQGSPFIKAESQGQQTQGGVSFSGRWKWHLSPDVSLDTRALYFRQYLEGFAVPCTHHASGDWNPCEPGEREGTIDFETPGRIGIAPGTFDSVNNVTFDFDDRERYLISTRLEAVALKDPLGGTHDFKFGAQGEQLVHDRLVGFSGNTAYFDLNTAAFDPRSIGNFAWREYSAPVDLRATTSQFAFFAQDSWRPVSNVTVNYGARFDAFVVRNDLGEPTVSGALLGPRLYASWDPFGDQRTKIATGYGRFNDTGRLGIGSFTSASGFGSKLYYGERFGWFQADSQLLIGDNPRQNLNVAADQIRSPRVDELMLILEREIVEDVAIFSHMSSKYTRFMFEADERNLVWDEDGSMSIGTRLGDPNNLYARLRTPELAQRDYYQWDVGFRKVFAQRWQAMASYTFAHLVGSSNSALSGSFLVDPLTRYNYGNLLVSSTHQVRASGFWRLPTDPFTASLGFSFRYLDGQPYDRFYWSEWGQGGTNIRIRPRGSYLRLQPNWNLDLSYIQQIELPRGDLQLRLNVSNVTNNRAPVRISTAVLSRNNRALVTVRQNPMEWLLGLTYTF